MSGRGMGTAGAPLGRRRFLALASGFLLAGCARLDESEGVQRVLQRFAEWNDRVGQAAFSPRRLAREFPETAISPDFKNNYHDFTPYMDYEQWWLATGGLVKRPPRKFRLADFRGMPKTIQTTELVCVEGWSAVAKWGGVRLSTFLDYLAPAGGARYLFLLAADDYWDFLDLPSALHPQTLLAYEMNDRPLTPEHGGPLRLVIPTKIGYKNVKGLIGLGPVAKNEGGFWDRQGYPWFYGL